MSIAILPLRLVLSINGIQIVEIRLLLYQFSDVRFRRHAFLVGSRARLLFAEQVTTVAPVERCGLYAYAECIEKEPVVSLGVAVSEESLNMKCK